MHDLLMLYSVIFPSSYPQAFPPEDATPVITQLLSRLLRCAACSVAAHVHLVSSQKWRKGSPVHRKQAMFPLGHYEATPAVGTSAGMFAYAPTSAGCGGCRHSPTQDFWHTARGSPRESRGRRSGVYMPVGAFSEERIDRGCV